MIDRRGLKLLEIGFEHELGDGDGPRRLDVQAPGRLVAHFLDGAVQGFDLAPGDVVELAADHVYVGLERTPGRRIEEALAEQAKPPRRSGGRTAGKGS